MMRLFRRSDSEAEAAFLEIFEAYHARIFTYVYRMTGCRESAEDIVQDVFLKVYQHLPHYQEEKKLTRWIFKIAHNATYDYFRKTQTHHHVFQEVDDIDTFTAQSESGFASPEDYWLTQELQEHVERTIINLPQKLKEVFLLRHEAGLSFKEISKLLHCPVNRLLGRMHLATKTIRAEIRLFIDGDT